MVYWILIGSWRVWLKRKFRHGMSYVKREFVKLIPLTIFGVLWKEMNYKDFESKEVENYRLRDRWFHYFGFILLRYSIIRDENFGNVINTLIHL